MFIETFMCGVKINKDSIKKKIVKKHNSVLEIDLGTISNNVKVLQVYCNKIVKHLAVVKADAYGHGSVEVAKKIAAQVDWFAVNNVREGVELRENGIDLPTLVFMPPEVKTADFYSDYNLTATVSAKEHFDLLKSGTEYHILFDTGMGRLGFSPAEAKGVLNLQKEHEELICTGIYSHFANAHDPKSPTLNEQYKLFKKICKQFDSELITHICNTGGIVQLPDAHLDLVRAGIGVYGFGPGRVDVPGLRSAMKWKTYLAQVKPIKKGEAVSYGSTWQCPADGFVGVLPVGFEDGLPRKLSGNLQVKIEDNYYSTVGIITMNYTMVYLQKQKFKTETEVLLLDDVNTARTWADTAGTIPYEIMARVSPKIPRKYGGKLS